MILFVDKLGWAGDAIGADENLEPSVKERDDDKSGGSSGVSSLRKESR